jgi:hypothetical protein
MTTRIYITRREIEKILKIMDENSITEGAVELIYNNSSGIGSTLDMEFDTELHGRYVVVRVNITDSDSW